MLYMCTHALAPPTHRQLRFAQPEPNLGHGRAPCARVGFDDHGYEGDSLAGAMGGSVQESVLEIIRFTYFAL